MKKITIAFSIIIPITFICALLILIFTEQLHDAWGQMYAGPVMTISIVYIACCVFFFAGAGFVHLILTLIDKHGVEVEINER